MAFDINFSVCQDNNCTDLTITDTSVGWISTLAFADVASATIQITDNNSIVTTFDVLSTITGASTTDDLVYEFDSDDITIGDGNYTIVFTIVDTSSNTYTVTHSYFFACLIYCCVDNLILGIKDYYQCSTCDSNYIMNALTAKALARSLQTAVKFNNSLLANDIFTTLTDMCNYENCDDCN